MVDADIKLVNKWLDESQSMRLFFLICLGNIKKIVILIWYDGAVGRAVAIEALSAELALAKEQALASNAAALKAVEELRAKQAAHRRGKDGRNG